MISNNLNILDRIAKAYSCHRNLRIKLKSLCENFFFDRIFLWNFTEIIMHTIGTTSAETGLIGLL